jgi:hypothetical protein
MSYFKKNQKVVKVLIGGGVKTATVQQVASVKAGKVRLVNSGLDYDAETGQEIDPVIPGFTSEIIVMEQ